VQRRAVDKWIIPYNNNATQYDDIGVLRVRYNISNDHDVNKEIIIYTRTRFPVCIYIIYTIRLAYVYCNNNNLSTYELGLTDTRESRFIIIIPVRYNGEMMVWTRIFRLITGGGGGLPYRPRIYVAAASWAYLYT